MPETVNDCRVMVLSLAMIIASAVIDSMVRPGKPSKEFSPSTVPCSVSVSSDMDSVPVMSICRSLELPGSVKEVEKVPLKELTEFVGMKVDMELCLKGEGSCNEREPWGAGDSSPVGAGDSSPVGIVGDSWESSSGEGGRGGFGGGGLGGNLYPGG